MRVVVSGGGSGGHIFPALAVAEALRAMRPDVEILYIGGTTGMETQIVPPTGIPFQTVTARKLRKTLSLSTVGVMFSLLKGYTEARKYLKAYKAEAVVGTGGYVAAATVLAGSRLGLPTLIHEGNVVPGRTNLVLSRFVDKVCVTFAETVPQFPKDKVIVTGLPLREGIVASPEVTPQKARCRFPELSANRFTLLIIGGSQGARAINRIVLEAAPALLREGVQILHQVGTRNIEEMREQARQQNLGEGYHLAAFFDPEQMPLAFRAADLVVCRGGVSTLAETTINGLPSLVIPLPTAYADHQTANAEALVSGGAAVLLPEIGLTAERLLEEVRALRDDTPRREKMAAASCGLACPHAAEEVAKLVLELGVR